MPQVQMCLAVSWLILITEMHRYAFVLIGMECEAEAIFQAVSTSSQTRPSAPSGPTGSSVQSTSPSTRGDFPSFSFCPGMALPNVAGHTEHGGPMASL